MRDHLPLRDIDDFYAVAPQRRYEEPVVGNVHRHMIDSPGDVGQWNLPRKLQRGITVGRRRGQDRPDKQGR